MNITCPKCHSENDAATDLTGGGFSPEEGDVGACIYCGCFILILSNGGYREMTLADELEARVENEREMLVLDRVVANYAKHAR